MTEQAHDNGDSLVVLPRQEFTPQTQPNDRWTAVIAGRVATTDVGNPELPRFTINITNGPQGEGE